MPFVLDAQMTLRSLFGAHFILTALVLMARWPSQAYLFYNGFLLALLIWTEMTPPLDAELPLLKCLVVEGLSVIFDIISMAACYGNYGWSGVEVFALVMAIVHLLGRLPSCFVLFRLREDRRSLQYGTNNAGGGVSTMGGAFGGISQPGPGGYEEFPPSYGAGGPASGGAGYSAHDTKPLPP